MDVEFWFSLGSCLVIFRRKNYIDGMNMDFKWLGEIICLEVGLFLVISIEVNIGYGRR